MNSKGWNTIPSEDNNQTSFSRSVGSMAGVRQMWE
jgi:hypothetical protein